MKKLSLLLVFTTLFLLPNVVNADTITTGLPGSDYLLLNDAITASGPTDVILLEDNITLMATQWIANGYEVTIDLGGFSISAPTRVFHVCGGKLTLTGEGIIRETTPDYGAIMISGSDSAMDSNYSVVNIGANIELIAWAPIFVTQTIPINPVGITPKSDYFYGVVVNFNGKATSVLDTSSDAGHGLYINGTYKNKIANYPIFNVGSSAIITSQGPGIYTAGYAAWTIEPGASVIGVDSALAIKAGKITINGGTFKATGSNLTPTVTWNNGINPSGAVIQIESYNSIYGGDIELIINGGTFISEHGYVIYEYTHISEESSVVDLKINNGEFIAGDDNDVFLLSDEFNITEFINGGLFSSNPTSYLALGINMYEENGVFKIGNRPTTPQTGSINVILNIVIVLMSVLGIVIIMKKKKIA